MLRVLLEKTAPLSGGTEPVGARLAKVVVRRSGFRLAQLAVCTLVLTGALNSATAQQVAVLPEATTNNEALSGSAEVAVQAVVEAFTSLGFTPSTSHDELNAAIAQCAEAEDAGPCLGQALRSHDFDYAVRVAVYSRAHTDTPYDLVVAAYDVRGALVDARERIGEGDIEDTARRAVAVVVAELRGETSSLLNVGGTPVGAAISVDGVPAGVLPRELNLSNGEHRVTISQAGYISQTRTIDVQEDMAVRFQLVPGEDEEAETPGGGGERRGPGLGIAMTALGLASAVAEVGTIVALAGCEEEVTDGCRDTQLGLGLGLGWGIATVALIGVGLWLWLSVGSDDEPAGEGTRVGLGPSTLQLEHHF